MRRRWRGGGTGNANGCWAMCRPPPFRAGAQLKASARAQAWAQLLGALLGAVVSVPVYVVIVKAYGLGTESMPSPAALSVRCCC